jgi:RNA-directed DNA polymerase
LKNSKEMQRLQTTSYKEGWTCDVGVELQDNMGAHSISSAFENGKDDGKQYADNLLEKILDRNNLNLAYKKVVSNKGSHGVDGMKVDELLPYLKQNGESLKASILEGTYRPSPVRRVEIPKPDGGKRLLGIPTAIDRMIQQAEGYKYVVDMDLEKYFDTVNQSKLIEVLSRTIKDGRVISLIHKYLRAGVMVAHKFEETTLGVPQGGPLSPLLSNIMLNELDKELERRGHRFVRYADDSAPRRRVQVA